MKCFLRLIFYLFIQNLCFAQPQNNLTGLYKGHRKNIYFEFEFYGNGIVKINQNSKGEFFHENDSLYVLTGNDVAIFSIQEKKIKGLSEWIKKEELKLISKNQEFIALNLLNERALLLKRFYLNNTFIRINNPPDNVSFFTHLENINQINEVLCEEGLDLACIQNYSYLTVLLENQLKPESDQTMENLFRLANRVIHLNNADGYGLMYTYYVLIDETEKGIDFLEKGLELGSELCAKLSLDSMYEEEQ